MADLSAIIDAITRTHIADDAVIVISDDDDDVLEVSAGERSGRERESSTSASRTNGQAAGPPVRGSQKACSLSEVNGRTAHGRGLPSASDTPGTRARCDAGGVVTRVLSTVDFRDAAESTGCPGGGRHSPEFGEWSASAASDRAASDSDSDVEYVPLCRRLALKQ